MSDIYTPEGTLDYAAAANELRGAKHISNAAMRAETVDRVGAAALVDIAASLNAIVQGLASGGVWLDGEVDEREVGPDGEPMGDEQREPGETIDPEPGDRVRLLEHLAAGGMAGEVVAVGVSEGEGWADVAWDDAPASRAWLRLLEFEPKAERATDAEGYDLDTPDEDEDDEPDPRDAVDDIDADFSPSTADDEGPRCGAEHPTVAGALCERRAGHSSTKHRKGTLKWADPAPTPEAAA